MVEQGKGGGKICVCVELYGERFWLLRMVDPRKERDSRNLVEGVSTDCADFRRCLGGA